MPMHVNGAYTELPTRSHPLHRLTPEQIDEIGDAFQTIHDEVRADLGERDADYIRSLIEFHRRLAALSRIVLMASRYPPAWLLGTTGLSVAKILENMELGHNIMHGQWDWMNDPTSTPRPGTGTPPPRRRLEALPQLPAPHVHQHRRQGQGRRLRDHARRPQAEVAPALPAAAVLQRAADAVLRVGRRRARPRLRGDPQAGTKPKSQLRDELKGDRRRRSRRQFVKDYVVFPALSGRKGFKTTLAANFTANFVRNIWSNAIIFCGHFPDQAYTFTEEEAADESRGAWYVRQLLGAANIDGSDTFHLMSGNLSYQVEHHLYPGHAQLALQGDRAEGQGDLRDATSLPYNTGPFLKQWLMVQRTILRLAFPGGAPRPEGAARTSRRRPVEDPGPVVASARGPIPAFPEGAAASPPRQRRRRLP